MVKWTIDPSLDGDAYADKPYLYSPALAAWNQFRIGDKDKKRDALMEKDHVVEEGADGGGAEQRSQLQIPETANERQKFFQKEDHRIEFEFESGRTYLADFGNQYLSFSGKWTICSSPGACIWRTRNVNLTIELYRNRDSSSRYPYPCYGYG